MALRLPAGTSAMRLRCCRYFHLFAAVSAETLRCGSPGTLAVNGANTKRLTPLRTAVADVSLGQNDIVSARAFLRQQADAPPHVGKARVGAQARHRRIDVQEEEKVRSFLVSLLQPRESLVLLVQTGIHDGEIGGGDVALLGKLGQAIWSQKRHRKSASMCQRGQVLRSCEYRNHNRLGLDFTRGAGIASCGYSSSAALGGKSIMEVPTQNKR